jgi:hypothetical protein
VSASVRDVSNLSTSVPSRASFDLIVRDLWASG